MPIMAPFILQIKNLTDDKVNFTKWNAYYQPRPREKGMLSIGIESKKLQMSSVSFCAPGNWVMMHRVKSLGVNLASRFLLLDLQRSTYFAGATTGKKRI